MNKKLVATYLALMGCALQTFAQGSTLQGPLPPQAPAAPATDLSVRPPVRPAAATPAGPRVTLRDIILSGNTLLDDATLRAGLGPISGESFDLAGLEALAARIESQYRAAGYPFTQAVLPPQDLKDGTLRIQVVEGRYGRVRAVGPDPLPASAQPFLDFGLRPGDAIENTRLERTLLILDDQPGMKIRPVIQPGARTGEADLSVNVERVSHVGGEVGLDNTGARSTGQNRARGAVFINSPFRYGDRISVNALGTDQGMLLGSLDYEMPIGASGLRGQVGYAYTNYQLGAQFAALDAKGYAKVTTARLSYPLIRSQATNVLLSVGYQHKNLEDRYDSTGLIRSKRSDSTPISIQFDRRDTLFGGGVSYGSLTWLPGSLSLDPGMDALDQVTARTAGHFSKLNLDVARIQQLTTRVHAYARYSGQWADKNLDSSEKFNLGGFYGIRAFPLGEGVGDQGWFTQLELRYDVGVVTPFVFHDAGHVETNVKPWDVNSATTRRLAASGLGVRSLKDGWSMDATVAWRTQGGAPTSEDVDRNPRLFVMVGRRF